MKLAVLVLFLALGVAGLELSFRFHEHYSVLLEAYGYCTRHGMHGDTALIVFVFLMPGLVAYGIYDFISLSRHDETKDLIKAGLKKDIRADTAAILESNAQALSGAVDRKISQKVDPL